MDWIFKSIHMDLYNFRDFLEFILYKEDEFFAMRLLELIVECCGSTWVKGGNEFVNLLLCCTSLAYANELFYTFLSYLILICQNSFYI